MCDLRAKHVRMQREIDLIFIPIKIPNTINKKMQSKTHSCGAILYRKDGDKIKIILGSERIDRTGEIIYLPFKGSADHGESFEDAAKREVYEETCGLVLLEKDYSISLRFLHSTKKKDNHLGIVEVKEDIVSKFNEKMKTETRAAFTEKRELKEFDLDDLFDRREVHKMCKDCVRFYFRAKIKDK